MERGIISFTNNELTALTNLAVKQGCQKDDLLQKLKPNAENLAGDFEQIVQVSEEDAEILLDCMPIPGSQTDPSIDMARIKIQQFLARSRFGEQA